MVHIRSVTNFLTLFLLISFGSLHSEIDQFLNSIDFLDLTSPNASVSQSKASNDSSNDSLVNFLGEPSAFVNGMVNAITGSYSDSQVDLVIPGVEPLVIQRSYSSSDGCRSQKGSLFHAWNLNHCGVIQTEKMSEQKNGYTSLAICTEGTAEIYYDMEVRYDKKIKNNSYRLTKEVVKNGLTNSGGGQISGRTNLKNNRLVCDIKNGLAELKMGSGGVQIFKETKTEQNENIYQLQMEKIPNGNRFSYEYSKERLSKIRCQNEAGMPLSSVSVKYGNFKVNPRMVLYSSDNRHVIYQFAKKSEGRFLLESMTHSDGHFDKYTYGNKKQGYSGHIIRKDSSKVSFVEIEYYDPGINEVGNTTVKCTKGDKSIGRVKLLRAPVGVDGTPLITHRFFYEFEMKKRAINQNEVKKGKTTVYDALDNKTNYLYNGQNRLTHLRKYIASNRYSTEKLFWGAENSPDEANLISRILKNGSGQIHFCCSYQYDPNGNVLKELLFGNLSGRNTTSIVLNSSGVAQKNGCEFIEKDYSYSNDGFNLVLSKSDARLTEEYSYYPNTDRLKSQSTRSKDNQIRQRKFYQYDANGSLIREVVDDGNHPDENQLSGVSERCIKSISPRTTMPIGLPQMIVEKAFDFSTGREVDLNTIVNTHTVDGKLTRQDHYDSTGQHRYSLSWEYDIRGNVIHETNALGQITSKTYDLKGNVLSEQGPHLDFCRKFLYDAMGRLIREELLYTNGTTLSICHQYNLLNQKIATTDIHGNTTEYRYDVLGRIIETRYPPVLNEEGCLITPVEQLEYDIMGNPIVKRDANGNAIHTAYTLRGQPCAVHYPDGSSEFQEYTLDGLLEKTIAKNGVVTAFTYDYLGRVIQKITYDASGNLLSQTSATYNAFHLLSETDAAGHVTYYQYNFKGQLQSVVKGDSKVVYEYDALGRVVKVSDYFGPNEGDYIAKVHSYDLLGRVIEDAVVDSSGTVQKRVRYSFNDGAHQTQVLVENQAGTAITTTTYNAFQEPVNITDPEGNQTRFIYHHSKNNACKEVVDPLGNVTVAAHDALGRVVSSVRKNPFGVITQQSEHFYDPVGNHSRQVETVRSNGADKKITTIWYYDNMQCIVALTEAAGTPEQKQTRYTYNRYGQKETVTKSDGVLLLHAYDALGRLSTLKASDDSISYQYCYDVNSNVIEIKDLIHQTSTLRAYDQNDRLIEETLGNGLTLTYAYDQQGKPTRLTLPDGSSITHRYEGSLLKEVQRLDAQEQPLYHFLYQEFDLSGNPLATQQIGNAGNITYQYDRMGRRSSTQSPSWQETIAEGGYDAAGNLLERTLTDTVGAIHDTYTYDDLYQLTSENSLKPHQYRYDSLYNRIEKDGNLNQLNALNQLIDNTTEQYTYDLNGNLKQQSGQEVAYAYDALDRLISVTTRNERYSYLYDAMNRRLTKSCETWDEAEQTWQPQSTLHFIYQGQNEIGACTADGQITQLRVLALGKGAEIGAAIALELGDQLYAPIHDHNGNLTQLVNAQTSQVYETYRFSAFGEERLFDTAGNEQETAANPWRYASKRHDPETGWLYFGRRYYDPQNSRWVTADPLGYEAGPNLYAYVLNNPLIHYDLYGLQAERDRDFRQTATKVASAAGRAFKSLAGLPGRTIEYLGRNWVPIPYVKDGIAAAGHLLAGRSFKNYVPNYMKHSFNGCIGRGEVEGVRVVISNGIMTSQSEMLDRAQELSYQLGGINVHFTYNQSRGVILDLLECLCQRVGISTNSAELMKVNLYQVANDLGGPNGGGVIMGEFHSQAGLVLNNIKNSLKEIKGMMEVTTLGSPVAALEADFAKAKNYVSGYDIVSWACAPVSCLEGKYSTNSNVHILPSKSTPWGEHHFDGENYSRVHSLFAKDINKRFGVYNP